jgi:hypothetical protein
MIIQVISKPQAGDPDSATEALEAVVHRWDEEFTVARLEPKELPAEERKVIDPVSLAALFLSIPSAALAAMNVADRMRKRHRAKQLIEKAEEVRASGDARVYVLTAVGTRPLETMDPDELLELATSSDEPSG